MDIKRNIEVVERQLGGKGCRLIAVSKTHPPEKILEAYQAGHRIFGENKVQELTAKYEALPKDIEWHLIGHLQTNKVKYVVPFVGLIHSVDSEKLLDEINKQGKKIGRVIPCLLQVHIAKEESKFGFDESELIQLLRSEKFRSYTHVEIRGLMGMATLTDRTEQIRQEFKELRGLQERLKSEQWPAFVQWKELSMGMSSDFTIAVEEGSTLVRVGTAIFGTRTPNSTL
jgi:pyridoxal phosphate enzyme (YggS family)